jgi:hypothetical protein
MTDVAKLQDTTGIYLIEVGPWFYYGRATCLYKRRSQHRRALERGIHRNPILQAAYNKYGQFSFEVVLECPKEDCPRWEDRFLKMWIGTDHCCNLRGAEGPLVGRRMSAETRQRMSAASKGKSKSAAHRAAVIEAMAPLRKAIGAKVSDSLTKYAIRVTYVDGRVEEYKNSRVAAEAIGCHRQSVDNFASGARCPQNPRSRKLGVLKVERF